MRNKAQTAMEYLMTYGWAILIVIVVVAALFAMGVFKLGAGAKCSPCFPSGGDFTFTDHNGVSVTLKIGPRDITFDPAFVLGGAGTSTSTEDVELTNGAVAGAAAYDAAHPPSSQDCSAGWSGDCKIRISYTVTDTGLTHSAEATLHQ